MGWISARSMKRGGSLYNEGPKRKGPLRKIVQFTSTQNDFFGSDSGWLECGHWLGTIFGQQRAICEKCRLGKPKDKKGKDGWPIFLNPVGAFTGRYAAIEKVKGQGYRNT